MKLGVQLYGLLRQCREQPEETFSKLHHLGYTDVEPCVFLGRKPENHPFWSLDEVSFYFPMIRKHGLNVSSSHIAVEDLSSIEGDLLTLVVRYGIKQIVMKCPAEISREDYLTYAVHCRKIGRLLQCWGAQLLLHNEYPEILGKIDGITAYEWLLDQCNGVVAAQPDVGWIQYGGIDPVTFLERNAFRIASLHYKDIQGNHRQIQSSQAGVCLGSGILNLKECYRFAAAHRLPQIIDQDVSQGDILEDMAASVIQMQNVVYDRQNMVSILQILDIVTGESCVLERIPGVIEAPNWLGDGETLLYNADGRIYRYSISTGYREMIDSGICDHCNNDHVPSADGQFLAVSHASKEDGCSRVYIVPIQGGEPRLVTKEAHSYLHGWSPDGKELVYCAFRKENVDIYGISVEGGTERRLTFGEGFNDGPEYAPNGKHIWFNSTRNGLMQIYRMNLDGSKVQQMTNTYSNNWFAHVSPDGTKVVYLAYPVGSLEPKEHLPNLPVSLWCMDYDGENAKMLTELFGGQGTINVNSWSPDSKKIAFVSYEDVQM